jgi:hypothetical protein
MEPSQVSDKPQKGGGGSKRNTIVTESFKRNTIAAESFKGNTIASESFKGNTIAAESFKRELLRLGDLWIVFCLTNVCGNISPRKSVVSDWSFDAIGRNDLVGDQQPLTQDAQQLSPVQHRAGSVLYTGSVNHVLRIDQVRCSRYYIVYESCTTISTKCRAIFSSSIK